MSRSPREASPDTAAFRAVGVCKRFPGVQALRDVDLDVHAGEVVGLVGENGAGKSTLIKILGGLQDPDAGELRIDGELVRFARPRDSLDRGIALLHQEGSLCENLSVAENVFLGRLPTRVSPGWLRPLRLLDWLGPLDHRRLRQATSRALAQVGLDLDPALPVARLGPGQRQLVEIARALSVDARLLIFDEPTSSLSPTEAERLLGRIAELRERGVAALYVSHRLDEVVRLADRVCVLRDGGNAGELRAGSITRDQMVERMVGRRVSARRRDPAPGGLGPSLLRVRGLRPRGAAHDVSFELRAGEILGFGGLVGAGRSEVVRTLFGIEPGEIEALEIDGRPVRIASPRDAIRRGLGLVPEDRKADGLVLDLSVSENVTLACRERLARLYTFIDRDRERAVARDQCARLHVRSASLDVSVGTLSGGNQQKVVLAKWLAHGGRVLILDEPTRGVDVGARAEIHELLGELCEGGLGILIVSSELDELVALCDRVCVFREGCIAGELEGDAIEERAILELAVGVAA